MGHLQSRSSSPPATAFPSPSSVFTRSLPSTLVNRPPFPEAANVVGTNGDDEGWKGHTGGKGEQCEKGETGSTANGRAVEMGHQQACSSSNPTRSHHHPYTARDRCTPLCRNVALRGPYVCLINLKSDGQRRSLGYGSPARVFFPPPTTTTHSHRHHLSSLPRPPTSSARTATTRAGRARKAARASRARRARRAPRPTAGPWI